MTPELPRMSDIHTLEDEMARLKTQNEYILDCYADLVRVHARLLIKTSDRAQIDRHFSDFWIHLGEDVIADLREMLNSEMRVERSLAANKLRAVA